MKYNVTGVKVTPMTKKDGMGTWNKIQLKTRETGETVLDLGFSVSKSVRDTIAIGSVIVGRVEQKTWNSNGKSGVNMVLEGITAEYVYDLLLKQFPNIEGGAPAVKNDGFGQPAAMPVADSFSSTPMPTVQLSDDINPDDIPF